MKCFYHNDRDAFGICKACGKGLCLECLEENIGGIFCKNDKNCKHVIELSSYAYKVMEQQKKVNPWLKKIGFIIILICLIIFIVSIFTSPAPLPPVPPIQ